MCGGGHVGGAGRGSVRVGRVGNDGLRRGNDGVGDVGIWNVNLLSWRSDVRDDGCFLVGGLLLSDDDGSGARRCVPGGAFQKVADDGSNDYAENGHKGK